MKQIPIYFNQIVYTINICICVNVSFIKIQIRIRIMQVANTGNSELNHPITSSNVYSHIHKVRVKMLVQIIMLT